MSGFSGKLRVPQHVAAASDFNPPLPQAVTMLSIPPAFPQTLPSFPGSVIANQTIAASPVSAFTTSVLAFSAQSATANQSSNQTLDQSMTPFVSVVPSLPATIASPPNISEQSPQPQIQVAYTAVTSPANSNPVPIPAPTLPKPGDPPSISTAPLTKTNPDPSSNQSSGPQTSSLQTSGIQTPTPQARPSQTSSGPIPILQASALPTSDIETPSIRTPSQTSAATVSSAPDSGQPASLVPPAYSVDSAAMQEHFNAQALNTAPDSALTLTFANAANQNSLTVRVSGTTLIAANLMLPQLAIPVPVPQSTSVTSNSTPVPPETTAATNQSQPVPSTPGSTLISALMAATPATAVRPVTAGKNNMATATTAGPLLPTIQSSLPQTALNDSTNLQKELSLAAAVALPTPSGNLPSVHTLANSVVLPVSATTHSAVGSSTPQNPSNGPSSNGPTTAAPSAIQVSPSSKGTSASATTTTDSSTDHLPPAIQLASQQPAPAPSAPNSPISVTTAIMPTTNADPPVSLHTQPPAPAAPTGDASNAAAELPPATLPTPGPVQMAQMVTRASQSEMRIGLTTSAFGSVEVRTVVHAGDVGLSVGSEKGDLHSLLSNELPTIANSLQQQSLRLTQVSFHQGSGLSGNSSSGGGSQQQRFTPSTPSGTGWSKNESPEISTESDESYSLSGGTGLNILA